MKTTLVVLLALGLGAASASAQLHKVKEKARNLDDKMTERHNSAENGAPPPGPGQVNKAGAVQPSVPPAVNQPPAAPLKPATQQQAAAKLKADIATIRGKGEVTAEARKEFVQDMKLAITGSSKPSAYTLDSFAASFLPAVSGKNVTAVSDARLVQNIVISLNSGGLSAARAGELATEVQTALTKAGAPEADAAKVAEGLRLLIADVQSGVTK